LIVPEQAVTVELLFNRLSCKMRVHLARIGPREVRGQLLVGALQLQFFDPFLMDHFIFSESIVARCRNDLQLDRGEG
jgi:hypothetical protein